MPFWPIIPIMGVSPTCCPPIIGISPEAPRVNPIGVPCVGAGALTVGLDGYVLVCASNPVGDAARIAATKSKFREDIWNSSRSGRALSGSPGPVQERRALADAWARYYAEGEVVAFPVEVAQPA